MKFKKGDKVVCIDSRMFDLILNKIYIISRVSKDKEYISITDDGKIGYRIHRFKLLSEFRKEKLKQLRNEL
jgi:hypothetical protein